MNKKEWLTLGVGAVVVVFALYVGGVFNRSASTTDDAVNNTNKVSTLPKVEGQNVSTDPKLQAIDVKVGTGAEAVAGKTVSVNYTGMLEDGTVFDSSYKRNQAFDFKLGAGVVIVGWDKGVAGMKVGGKRRLVISPDYGYGASGIPGAIPPSATLYFDVELMAVK